jgi:ribosome-associated toxin RatA of RatAB toxin-antitoxin module
MTRVGVMGLFLAALLPIIASAQSTWLADPLLQRRLADGEVIVRPGFDAHEPKGRVYAAVRIRATADVIWNVMRNCEEAPSFVPGLKRCRRLEGAPDGSWEIIEHEVKYSWLLPTVHYVFRADYQRPHRIDFHRVSGDLKDQEGTWRLEELADASATIVEYEVYLDPGFWVPEPLVRHTLRRDLPAVLRALRDRVESSVD